MVEKKIKKRNGTIDYKLVAQLIPERNDQWLNSHIRPVLEVWMANIDIQVIVDNGKVIEYLTKYMTKAETMNEVGIKRMFKNILNQTSSVNATPQVALRKMMLRLLGERTYGRQEISHLINSIPIAKSSHQFVRVNLKNTAAPLSISSHTEPDNNQQIQQQQQQQQQQPSIISLTIIDFYARRNEIDLWANASEFHEMTNDLEDLSFFDFLKQCYIVTGKKIKLRSQSVEKKVFIITPIISPKSDGPKYPEYCKYMLIKYKPWTISVNRCIPEFIENEEIEITPQHFVDSWESYKESLRESNQPIPESFINNVSLYTSDMRTLRENNSLQNTQLAVQDDYDSDEDIPETENDEDVLNMIDASGGQAPIQLNSDETEDFDIEWAENHDFTTVDSSELALIEGQQRLTASSDRSHFAERVIEVAKAYDEISIIDTQRRSVQRSMLNIKQKQAHDFFVKAIYDINSNKDSYTDDPENNGFPRLQLLLGAGGCGKSFLLDAALTTLKEKLNIPNNHIMIAATTGKAATSIGGSTIYSYSNGACIPCGRMRYSELKNQALDRMQERFGDIEGVVIDEFSMLDAKSLYILDQRLRQAKSKNLPFGGIVVLLCGDTAQLPPVKGTPVWGPTNNKSTAHEESGINLFNQFHTCTILTESNRLDPNDPEYEEFKTILQQLRDGTVTEDSWKYLTRHNTLAKLGDTAWNNRGFNSDDCIHLYCTNKKVNQRNKYILQKSDHPIAKIDSLNMPPRAKQDSGENTRQLPVKLFLSNECKVMLLWNINTEHGLVNGCTGIVKEMFYKPSTEPPSLPAFVIVDFGSAYKGPKYFDTPEGETTRDNWVPIFPVTIAWNVQRSGVNETNETYSRTMLPIKLSYAWTIWKAQGQTISKPLLIDLESNEKKLGLTYTAFPSARRYSQI